jgi:hypothetical protein
LSLCAAYCKCSSRHTGPLLSSSSGNCSSSSSKVISFQLRKWGLIFTIILNNARPLPIRRPADAFYIIPLYIYKEARATISPLYLHHFHIKSVISLNYFHFGLRTRTVRVCQNSQKVVRVSFSCVSKCMNAVPLFHLFLIAPSLIFHVHHHKPSSRFRHLSKQWYVFLSFVLLFFLLNVCYDIYIYLFIYYHLIY